VCVQRLALCTSAVMYMIVCVCVCGVQRLALCTSAVMYMMSRDHISMHIDSASLQLMLRLLSIDCVADDAAAGTANSDEDYQRTRQRIHDIVQHTGHDPLSLDNLTVSIDMSTVWHCDPRVLHMET